MEMQKLLKKLKRGATMEKMKNELTATKELMEAVKLFEKKQDLKFPNKCSLKILNYKEGENVLSLGFIHNAFVMRVNNHYEIFKDKKELKMKLITLSTPENENSIAFWLQEIEYLEYTMKEIHSKKREDFHV